MKGEGVDGGPLNTSGYVNMTLVETGEPYDGKFDYILDGEGEDHKVGF